MKPWSTRFLIGTRFQDFWASAREPGFLMQLPFSGSAMNWQKLGSSIFSSANSTSSSTPMVSGPRKARSSMPISFAYQPNVIREKRTRLSKKVNPYHPGPQQRNGKRTRMPAGRRRTVPRSLATRTTSVSMSGNASRSLFAVASA